MSDPTDSEATATAAATATAFLASRVGAVPITITAGLDPEEIEEAVKLELGLEGQVAVTVYGAPHAPRPRRLLLHAYLQYRPLFLDRGGAGFSLCFPNPIRP